MKERNEALAKTINHNNQLRASRKERVKKDMLDIQEREAIRMYKEGKLDMVNLLKSPADTLAVYSKATRTDNVDKTDMNLSDVTDESLLQQLRDKVTCTIENNKRIIALFPEVKLAIEIIISSILSPNKLTETQLIYKLRSDFELGDEDIKSKLLNVISEYIDNHYDLSTKLPDILTEVLMNSGACPHLILSEAVVDDVVNSDILMRMGMEDYKGVVSNVISELTRPIGIINVEKDKDIPSLEKLEESISNQETIEEKTKLFVDFLVKGNHVRVTDNQGIFKLNEVKKNLRSNIIRSTLRGNATIAMESTERINFFDLFRDRRTGAEYKPTIILHDKKEATRKAIGKPMVKQLPTESVFPALALGNKDEHLGYFVLLDDNGESVTSEKTGSAFEKLNNSLNGDTFTASPISSVYNDLIGEKGGCIDLDGLYEMYKDVMEKQLFDYFKKSIYGEEIIVANAEDFYYVMFSRALQAQRTSILFVPKESLVYFALFHNESGLGKTLLDDLNTIFSMRAILLFAKVMAQTRNAIDITNVVASLDPKDPDPDGTMERIKTGMLKLRSNDFPLGENDPTRLIDWITKAGLRFTFKNHPDIPDMEIDFEKSNMQYDEPDSEFYEDLGKRAISGMGLPPEVIDQAYSPEFAAGIFQNSALLAKRTTMYQNQLTPELTKFVNAIIYTDEDLRKELSEVIRKNLGEIKEELSTSVKTLGNLSEEEFLEYYMDELSKNVHIELPHIAEGNINNLAQDFEEYKSHVDNALQIVLSDELFSSDNAPLIAEKVPLLRAGLTALLCRRWAAENNYLPELFSVIGVNEVDTKEALEGMESHMASVYKTVVDLLESLTGIQEAGSKDMTRLADSGESSSSGW